MAQKRRRDVLYTLLALMFLTLTLGLVLGMRTLLYVHVVLDLLFAGYVALLIRMRNVAAEKEYAEAVLTAALIAGDGPLPFHDAVGVELPAWLNGLAEAASELRRHLLDRLREGDTAEAERLLHAMEDVYDLLVTVDYPDAITGGLRRTTDAIRGIIERTRGDLSVTLIQDKLRLALESKREDA